MAGILGIKGTGTFTTNVERPMNWREMILYLFPNGEAPLTALLSKLSSEGTDDYQFHWFEKALPTQRFQLNANVAQGATSMVLKTAGGNDEYKFWKAGHLFMHENTGEIALVTADPSSNTISITKGWGEVNDTGWNANDYIVIIGTVYAEGASAPTPIGYAPDYYYNYTQIFRDTLGITRTAKKTRLRTGDAYEEAKRECLQFHSIQLEKAFIFGNRYATTSGGQRISSTRGILKWISTNVFDAGGTLTESEWDTYMEAAFRYGSSEKLALVGSTALNVLNQLAKGKSTIQVVPGNQTYGMNLVRYESPFGILYLRMHPLFNDHPEWRKMMVIIDTDKIKYRFIDDTDFYVNRQSPGTDASLDEFLTEAGLEVHHEKCHAYITNITSFAP